MSLPRITEILNAAMWPATIGDIADYTTTATFADVTGSKIDTYGKTNLVFTIKNTGANSIDWKVLASVDDSTYVEVEASAPLAASASASWVAAAAEMAYRYFKIQAQDTTPASHGAAQVRAWAKA